MLATVIHAARDIRVEEVADPVLSTGGDAIVRVVAACVCGSDLWPYRGVTATHEPHRIGHEFVGVVEAVGPEVRAVSSAERSQARNRAHALDQLAGRLANALRVERPRVATRATRGSKERRIEAKRQRSDTKRQRRRPVGDD